MHSRTALTFSAAVLTAGLLSLAPTTATATNPTGGAVATAWVNGGPTPAGPVPINGPSKGGSVSFAGGTYACGGGYIDGTVERGPRPLGAGVHDMTFSTLTLVCGGATISVDAGCAVTADFPDTPNPNVHDGTVDTGTGPKFNRVDGTATMPPNCVRISTMSGFCLARITGTLPAYFAEAVHAVSGRNYQDLILNGTGLTLSNQSAGCLGMMTGGITFNNIVFDVEVTGGTTTGIDFRQTP